MISNDMEIMLYVDNVTTSKMFWEALGFVTIDVQELDGTMVVEIAPSQDAEVHFVLYERSFIETYSPEVATNSPSVMFQTKNIEAFYRKLLTLDVEVGELIQLDDSKLLNFADPDGNYYAIKSHN
ncbi:VOC family protein [Enterococcus camelliae]|jgi:lactoylglutathione lyase|uniref:VOC family protein n=1 Tax=Enterococcus camelliae TaxID=453959 RepID=A0ABW5TGT5_9ENTE